MTGLYDLHTHTTLSDGEMLPIELVRRLSVLGYTTVAITDHVDASNMEQVIRMLLRVVPSGKAYGVRLLCGVEITHVPPEEIPDLAREAKGTGADIVVVHGETPVEPVAPGTNHAACACRDVDLLAHPGLLAVEDAIAAARNGLMLELTSRGGHNRTNGHVARIAREAGCPLAVNSDAHGPQDLLDIRAKTLIARGAGLSDQETEAALTLNKKEWLFMP